MNRNISKNTKTSKISKTSVVSRRAEGPPQPTEVELSDIEKAEIEAGEKARLGSDSWDAPPPGKADNFGQSFKRMIGLLAPFKGTFIILTLMGAASVVLSVWAPRVLGRATDVLFSGFVGRNLPPNVTVAQAVEGLRAAGQDRLADMLAGMPNLVPGAGIDFHALGRLIALALGIYVVSAILSWLSGYLSNVVMVKAMWRLREQIEVKVNRLPLSYFDKVQRGELISRVTNDVDNITNTMQQSLSGAVSAILTIIGVLAMMFSISWRLALIVLISLPLNFIIFGIIGPKSQKAFKTQWRKVGRLNSRVEESFSGHALVKTFNRRQEFQDQFETDNEELYESSFKAQFWSNIMWPAMSFIGNITYVAMAVIGGVMVARGSMSLGDVQAFIQYTQMFNQPVGQLGGMISTVQSGTASAERIFELLDEPEQSPYLAEPETPIAGNGTIEFKNVAFSYNPDKSLINNLSFDVRPGHTVAIVGHTGAGKTTLVNLLMRYYDVDGGEILVDGQNIANLTRHDARARTGMVLQDTWLFAGTIMENIRYGRPDATDEEVIAAAKATYVDRFVHSLPDGYNTVLEEDAANLSAGERQLITIARAFVSQPDILILDEATSSVDTRTEKLVQKAMASLREGRTSFVIAHRLSTIRDADLILVMEHGDIVEQGNHNELIAADGAYNELYQSQFAGAVA